jgi:hypothetical protein
MSVVLINHMLSIIFIDAKCEGKKNNMRKNNVVAELFLLSILYVLFEIYPGNIFIMHTACY